MIFPGFQMLAQAGVGRVVNSLPEGLLLALFVWMFLRFTGRHGSEARFAAWFVTLIAIAALPFAKGVSALQDLTAATHPQIILPAAWAVAIFTIWAVMASVAALRVAIGIWKVHELRKNSLLVLASHPSLVLREASARLGIKRQVEIRTSPDISVPTAIGFLRPSVLLPPWALEDLSPDELEPVLLHELAHLQRWDDWTNLAQKVIRTAFFFHPAVWWIEKRLSLEREIACDDVVLAATEDPRGYAECLVALAEKSFVRRGLAMAQAMLGRAKDTSVRLAHILNGKRNATTRTWKGAVGIVAAVFAFGFVVIPNAPVLVAFDHASTETSFASAGSVESLPLAHVIPAKLNLKAEPQIASNKDGAQENASRKPQRPASVIPAKHKTNHPQPPQVVRAELRQSAPVVQFVVVMQRAVYDDSGSAMVRFAVWRVTFVTSSPSALDSPVVSKSI